MRPDCGVVVNAFAGFGVWMACFNGLGGGFCDFALMSLCGVLIYGQRFCFGLGFPGAAI